MIRRRASSKQAGANAGPFDTENLRLGVSVPVTGR